MAVYTSTTSRRGGATAGVTKVCGPSKATNIDIDIVLVPISARRALRGMNWSIQTWSNSIYNPTYGAHNEWGFHDLPRLR